MCLCTRVLQDAVDGALHDVAVVLQQALPSGGPNDGVHGCGAWNLPFQDLMLRNYITSNSRISKHQQRRAITGVTQAHKRQERPVALRAAWG
eukprot:scaffold192545_cov23-Tisochrysis_lutea.AAC.1